MYVRENEREETFCQLMANGNITAKQAYIQAGYSVRSSEPNSCRKLSNAKVKNRIAAIKAELDVKRGITREIQALKLADLRARCQAEGDHSNEMKTIAEENALYGLIITKTQDMPIEGSRKLSEAEQAEARRIAQLVMDDRLKRATEYRKEVLIEAENKLAGITPKQS